MYLITKVSPDEIDILQKLSKQTFFESFSWGNTEENMARYLEEGSIAAGAIFLLRPHLAVALLVGLTSARVFIMIGRRLKIFSGGILVSVMYVFGAYAYSLGTIVRDGFNPGTSDLVFSQQRISQVALNFTGLQFLSQLNEDESIVASSLGQLLAARLLLFDSLIIPATFVLITIFALRKLKVEAIHTLSSFVFFLGLVTQTDFNSTRQNLPFYALMGIICVVNLSRPATNQNPELKATRVG